MLFSSSLNTNRINGFNRKNPKTFIFLNRKMRDLKTKNLIFFGFIYCHKRIKGIGFPILNFITPRYGDLWRVLSIHRKTLNQHKRKRLVATFLLKRDLHRLQIA